MIERYSTEKMTQIWSEENKFKKWLDVEIAVCEAWAELGKIPKEAVSVIKEKATFDIKRIKEIEKEVNHDVIAFVTNVAESVGEYGRYIHLGLTSYDVVDTAKSLLLMESICIVKESLVSLMESVYNLAKRYKYTPCVGRTHGVHAEPMTFGLKVINWYYQLERDLKRLEYAKDEISYGKVSGAVGTYAHCPPQIEQIVCKKLGLKPAKVSNQILQRDRHAFVLSVLSILASTLERIALEIRHLQRTEVLEALEPFGKKQKGSSAMPHKKNPVICERVCGLARLIRSYLISAIENVALWHERDISHSSVERIIFPDAFNLIHYMLLITKKVIDGIVVNEKKMLKNLDLTKGLIYSQRVLLKLVESGMQRDKAYEIVQRCAMKSWEEGIHFMELLLKEKEVVSLIKEDELKSLFDPSYYVRYVDEIFSRFQN